MSAKDRNDEFENKSVSDISKIASNIDTNRYQESIASQRDSITEGALDKFNKQNE